MNKQRNRKNDNNRDSTVEDWDDDEYQAWAIQNDIRMFSVRLTQANKGSKLSDEQDYFNV